jgi:NADPH:quinone reductase-like Zn-dependent oxidoreductase
MKAAVIYEYGSPDVLKYVDCPEPTVGPGEVLVRVAAASINPVDTYERAGMRKDRRPLQFPAVLGWDLAGIVLSAGPEVRGFSAGDPVLAWAYHTYAELCVVKAELLARIPNGLDVANSAALPLVTLTGSQLISAGGAKRGQTVLVSGAMGAVGRAAIFTARELGAVVIAGVRRQQMDSAKSLGADKIVALDEERALNELAPVDVVANTVRGKTGGELLGKVKAGGVFASVTGAPANAQEFPSVRVASLVARQDTSRLQYLTDAAAAGKLVIPISLRLPLRSASDGHAAVEKGGIGKVLLLP